GMYIMSWRSYVVLVLVSALLTICACMSGDSNRTKLVGALEQSPQVRYQYDAVGRLIHAASVDGTSVQYTYDPAGNITAIRRLSADTLSVIDFIPRTGSIGSTVTICGSGFDSNPAATRSHSTERPQRSQTPAI